MTRCFGRTGRVQTSRIRRIKMFRIGRIKYSDQMSGTGRVKMSRIGRIKYSDQMSRTGRIKMSRIGRVKYSDQMSRIRPGSNLLFSPHETKLQCKTSNIPRKHKGFSENIYL